MFNRSIIIFLAVLICCACADEQAPENIAELGVSFNWTKQSQCTKISPPIHLTNIPPGTKYLKVTMPDLNAPRFNHGGGEIRFKGKETIKEGALETYQGPCPFGGKTHSYEIAVLALGSGKKILGQGKAVKEFTVKMPVN